MTWTLLHIGASKADGADTGMIPGKVTATGLNEGHLPLTTSSSIGGR